ncbi:hypothetical protein FHL15_005835 [Xylaria flabelliformis]|uniref:Major facilitator superfamily (MFS) profile domain-containing protein n=1 Tax=Xylaria flabelliformis TaxID=2512241 RepID=A0A553HZ67_9PEZI|nr:hypothetical protein FHL15_005835 [Xylaria flabelliformis]
MSPQDTARSSFERSTNTSLKGGNGDIEACEMPGEKDNLDDDIVDWDGPDDPENPLRWSKTKKNAHIIIVSVFALVSNLAATMFAPGAAQLASDFHITDPIIETFTVNIYLLAFAVGPITLAPLSEIYGRLIIYHVCNAFFIAFTVGCAFSTNVSMFLVFRLLAGLFASGPLSIGGGTIADVTTQGERGRAIALWGLGPLLGPAGLQEVVTFIFMRETNATVLLRRKTTRLIKESGNHKLVPKAGTSEAPKQILLKSIVRPAKMIVFSPIVLLISLYAGLLYGLIFLLNTTFPAVFEETYNFSTGVAGLAYLGLGLGFLSGLLVFSILSDRLLKLKKDATKDGITRPEERLILMKWIAPITPLGLFLYGWTAEYHIHWIVPIIGTFIVGFGSLFILIPAQAYLVDSFGSEASASALAANLIVRAPFGALFGLVAPPLYGRLGLGWGNSVLGFITLAFTPVPWLLYHYGETLRKRFPPRL